ncbi:MAG: helical backbone metal receptor [Verrucomicrobiota bacterium]
MRQLFVFLVPLCLFLFSGCGKQPTTLEAPENVRRVVSLAPSITECIFAAGGGDRLVGVTSYCNYPAEANALPKIGGYADANYEAIYTLKPDLVIILDEHFAAAERLAALGIPHLRVDTTAIPGILQTLETLGEVFQTRETAEETIARLKEHIAAIKEHTAGEPPRRVLVSIGRNMGTGGLSDVYVAGSQTLYNEILDQLGAQNVYTGNMEYARISFEGIMRLDPDVIIDLIPDLETAQNLNIEKVRNEWNSLANVAAVKNREVHVFGGDYVCVPGPRFALIFEDIARAVYPSCFEKKLGQDD